MCSTDFASENLPNKLWYFICEIFPSSLARFGLICKTKIVHGMCVCVRVSCACLHVNMPVYLHAYTHSWFLLTHTRTQIVIYQQLWQAMPPSLCDVYMDAIEIIVAKSGYHVCQRESNRGSESRAKTCMCASVWAKDILLSDLHRNSLGA